MSRDLKPCPFCGGNAHPRTEHDPDNRGHLFAFFKCGGCHAATGRVYGTGHPSEWAEAREAWNRRAQAPAAEPLTDDARDAARWRAMRAELVSVDWQYQDDPDLPVAIFMMHGTVASAGPEGADLIADAAIAAAKEQP